MKEYVSSSIYRKFLTMLAATGLKLPETVNLTVDGVSREFTVLHKIELADYPPRSGLIEPVMSITSWAVVSTDGMVLDAAKTEVVDPERDWVQFGHFWVGKTEKVYRDVSTINDKKLTGFGWCGNAERELMYPSFCLLKDGPLFTTQVRLASLELFTPPQQVSSLPTTKVGLVEADGTFTASPETASAALQPVDASIPARVGVEHLAAVTRLSEDTPASASLPEGVKEGGLGVKTAAIINRRFPMPGFLKAPVTN